MIMTNKGKLARININFEINAKKAFPSRSMFEITKELNSLLEQVIYGTKPNIKKKRKSH